MLILPVCIYNFINLISILNALFFFEVHLFLRTGICFFFFFSFFSRFGLLLCWKGNFGFNLEDVKFEIDICPFIIIVIIIVLIIIQFYLHVLLGSFVLHGQCIKNPFLCILYIYVQFTVFFFNLVF